MRSLNVKRWVAGFCAAALLAGVPAMVGYALEGDISDEAPQYLSDSSTESEMDVKVHVDASSSVSYLIAIPAKVDFGTIQQPNLPGTYNTTKSFTVECTQLNGLQSGQVLSVLVKDSTALDETDPFKLVNEDNAAAELHYTIFNKGGNDVQESSWYENGFLLDSFTAADQTATCKMQLDVGQLYGENLDDWGGNYTGKLVFTSKVTSISDVDAYSMSEGEGTPVA